MTQWRFVLRGDGPSDLWCICSHTSRHTYVSSFDLFNAKEVKNSSYYEASASEELHPLACCCERLGTRLGRADSPDFIRKLKSRKCAVCHWDSLGFTVNVSCQSCGDTNPSWCRGEGPTGARRKQRRARQPEEHDPNGGTARTCLLSQKPFTRRSIQTSRDTIRQQFTEQSGNTGEQCASTFPPVQKPSCHLDTARGNFLCGSADEVPEQKQACN